MMPEVTDGPPISARGFPIATAMSPIVRAAGSPMSIGVRSALSDPEHCYVGQRVGPDDLRRVSGPIGEDHGHLLGALDDVVVGDQVSVESRRPRRCLRSRRASPSTSTATIEGMACWAMSVAEALTASGGGVLGGGRGCHRRWGRIGRRRRLLEDSGRPEDGEGDTGSQQGTAEDSEDQGPRVETTRLAHGRPAGSSIGIVGSGPSGPWIVIGLGLYGAARATDQGVGGEGPIDAAGLVAEVGRPDSGATVALPGDRAGPLRSCRERDPSRV